MRPCSTSESDEKPVSTGLVPLVPLERDLLDELVESWPSGGLERGGHLDLELAEVARRGGPLGLVDAVPGCGCVRCLVYRLGGVGRDIEEARMAVTVLAEMPHDERLATATGWAQERARLGRDVRIPSPAVLVALATLESPPPKPQRWSTRIDRDWSAQVDSARAVSLDAIVSRLRLGPVVRRWREARIVCPFHEDTNPSLRMNETKGLWYCDPCGAKGDGIGLYMQYTGLGFVETVKELVPSRS